MDNVLFARLKKYINSVVDQGGGSGGYVPPVGGIPRVDLAKDVRDSLSHADNALLAQLDNVTLEFDNTVDIQSMINQLPRIWSKRAGDSNFPSLLLQSKNSNSKAVTLNGFYLPYVIVDGAPMTRDGMNLHLRNCVITEVDINAILSGIEIYRSIISECKIFGDGSTPQQIIIMGNSAVSIVGAVIANGSYIGSGCSVSLFGCSFQANGALAVNTGGIVFLNGGSAAGIVNQGGLVVP